MINITARTPDLNQYNAILALGFKPVPVSLPTDPTGPILYRFKGQVANQAEINSLVSDYPGVVIETADEVDNEDSFIEKHIVKIVIGIAVFGIIALTIQYFAGV